MDARMYCEAWRSCTLWPLLRTAGQPGLRTWKLNGQGKRKYLLRDGSLVPFSCLMQPNYSICKPSSIILRLNLSWSLTRTVELCRGEYVLVAASRTSTIVISNSTGNMRLWRWQRRSNSTWPYVSIGSVHKCASLTSPCGNHDSA
jgi:hypothetical protein